MFCDNFFIYSTFCFPNKNIEGTLKPGVDATPHAVHVSLANQTSLIVGCLIDGFQSCRELIVPAVAKNFQVYCCCLLHLIFIVKKLQSLMEV